MDYSDTFSPVAKLTSIRLWQPLMAGTSTNLILKMLFFMGILQKKFIWSNLLGLLLRGRLVEFVVFESLYGLKQSPRAWFEKFSEVIEKFGMQKSK